MKAGVRGNSLPPGCRLVASRTIGEQRIYHLQLENGLQLLVWEDSQSPVAAYQTWFRVGSGHEQPTRSGMAHLFEHLMFKETKKRKAGEFDRILETNGIETNAATSLDWTYYKENLPSQHLALVMELEADRMQNMILSQSQLDTERDVVKNERLLRVDNDPDGKTQEVMYHMHFGRHPYGHPTIGWMKDILAITLDDCLEFHRRYYAPDNALIAVCGDVQVQQVAALAHRYYGPIPRGTGAPQPRLRRHVPKGLYKQMALPVTMGKVQLLYEGPNAGHADTTVFRILSELLWGAESSLLREQLLHRQQLVTDVMAYHAPFRLAGAIEFQLNLAPDVTHETAFVALQQSLREFVAKGVTEKELEGAKNRVEMGYHRSLLPVGSRARGLGHWQTTLGDWRQLTQILQRLGGVTAQQCVSCVQRYLLDAKPTRIDVMPSGAEVAE